MVFAQLLDQHRALQNDPWQWHWAAFKEFALIPAEDAVGSGQEGNHLEFTVYVAPRGSEHRPDYRSAVTWACLDRQFIIDDDGFETTWSFSVLAYFEPLDDLTRSVVLGLSGPADSSARDEPLLPPGEFATAVESHRAFRRLIGEGHLIELATDFSEV